MNFIFSLVLCTIFAPQKMLVMKDYLVDKIEEISFERVELNDSLWQAGVLDSITIVELAVDIEEEFGIDIPFDEIIEANFETLGRLMAFIEKKQNA